MSKLREARKAHKPNNSRPEKAQLKNDIQVSSHNPLTTGQADRKSDLAKDIDALKKKLAVVSSNVEAEREKNKALEIQAQEAVGLAQQAIKDKEEANTLVNKITEERDALLERLGSYKDGAGDTIYQWPVGSKDLHVHPYNKKHYGMKVQTHVIEKFKKNGQLSVGGFATCKEDGKKYIIDGTSRWTCCNDDEIRAEHFALTGKKIEFFLAKDWGVMTEKEIQSKIDDANTTRDLETWMVLSIASDDFDRISEEMEKNKKNGKKLTTYIYKDLDAPELEDHGRTTSIVSHLHFGGQSHVTIDFALRIYRKVMSDVKGNQDELRAHWAIKGLGDNPMKLKNSKKIWQKLNGELSGDDAEYEKAVRDDMKVMKYEQARDSAKQFGMIPDDFEDILRRIDLTKLESVEDFENLAKRLEEIEKYLVKLKNESIYEAVKLKINEAERSLNRKK